MKKKIGAILISVIMVVACLPTLAIADEPEVEENLMFELATELEEDANYLLVSNTASGGAVAMQNNEGSLNAIDVDINADNRIVITEDEAAETMFTVKNFTGKEKHSTGKLANNDQYLGGTKTALALTNESSAEIFNTWDYNSETEYRLCGLGATLRYSESNGWNANADGAYVYIYKQVPTVTVTFDIGNHGTVNPESEFLKEGDVAQKPVVEAQAGYLFMGWFDEDSEWNFENPVYEDMTLTAKWEKAVKFELADELEEGGEYILVNKNSETGSARIMELNGYDLSYFDGSVSTGKVVILGEEQMKNSVFTAVDCRDDGGLKKAKLQMGEYYIGEDATVKADRLLLVEEGKAGEFNTYNYGGTDGWKLCGYGYWIRNTGNTTGLRDGGWWATDRFGNGYTGAYLYKKAVYEATVTADDKEKLCTETDPELTATVDGVDFPCDIEYTIERESGDICGTYDIIVSGEETQANYSVEYVNGTLTIKHVLDKIDRIEPTTEKPGHLEAYRCKGCGTYFTDAAGENIIGDQEAYEKWISEGGAGYLEKIKISPEPKTGDATPLAETSAMVILALLMVAYVCIELKKQY